MKKFYLLIGAGAIVVSANAQRSTTFHGTLTNHAVKHMPETRAVGDTLMIFTSDLVGGTGIDGTFNVIGEDLDLLPSTTTNNFPDPDFGLFYSLQTWDYIPGEIADSAFFYAATSWFNSPGQADNWLEFGPITIPSGAGASMSWYVKNNPAYRDGYEVLINTNGMSAGDFTDPAIYSRADFANGTTFPADTTWGLVTATIPASYSGQAIYVAFHHNANDMDVLYLDQFVIKEALLSVNEVNNDFTMSEVFPNPFNNNANFSINLNKAADVSYTITDLSGKVLVAQKELNRPAGNNRITISSDNMAAGMYYLNVTAGSSKMTKKIQVVK